MKELIQERVAEIEVSYQPAISNKPKITGSLDAYNVLLPFFPTETIALQERFVAMYLNRSNRVLGIYPLSIGGITGTVADTKLILGIALKTAATAIILAHNHPSGNLKPSSADIELTKKIKSASTFMDILVNDHIILSANGEYYSFADEGLI